MRIIFLRHTPIDVDKKMYEIFCMRFDHQMTVAAETHFDDARTMCGYNDESCVITTVYCENQDPGLFYEGLFKMNPDALFLINGLGMAKKYQNLIRRYGVRFAVVAERDNYKHQSRWKSFLKKVFPRIQKIRYRFLIDHASFFLCMGQSGTKCYIRYGVPKRKVFEFMYCGGETEHPPAYHTNDLTVRFLYIGRFDYDIKGVDILLKAFLNCKGDYSLDLIGGYGSKKDEIMQLIRNHPQIKCNGLWKNCEVCEKMNAYAVVVVPSKFDGWNLHNNFSILASVACITTDQAGSDGLIKNCQNGFVIKSNSANQLKRAIETILRNPEIIGEFKRKTSLYQDKISPLSVAHYLNDILQYVFEDKMGGEKPIPTWINKEG